jgi:hypothetical protein
MKKTVYLYFIAFVLMFSCNLYAGITAITHINEAKPSLENANADTLVLFDVDRTLVMMGDQLLNSGKAGFLKKIKTYPAYDKLSQEEKDHLLSIVLLKTTHQIIENNAVDIIDELQKKNIKTIAFTALWTGRFGSILNMEQWRINNLKTLGLCFKNAFPDLQIIFFPDQMESPLFKEGVLMTAQLPKGEVLRLFLNKLNWHPKKIIMIDDQLSYLESVEAVLNELKIEFQGFQYQYVEELLKKQILDEALINFQINYLLEHHDWLTDDKIQSARLGR